MTQFDLMPADRAFAEDQNPFAELDPPFRQLE